MLESVLELSELIASVAGYMQFMSAATQFYQLHAYMDSSRYTAAEMESLSDTCIYSCCASIDPSALEVPSGTGAWNGTRSDTVVIFACLGGILGLVGVCAATAVGRLERSAQQAAPAVVVRTKALAAPNHQTEVV